ncbi:outer membrane protein [Bradyrhizobium sacchari]|uniref:Opacity protein-like surface antigen n=1 Tax=Bradyrhizobium sacchari TaxID=1399419 RepID=A0A560JYN0_9BRAD|nr:outer membrane beta-barrel protein [Bradyrhizobium sacchari]TWB62882.1 opacity protein-like surface antigen [Bradyrhizobium sacchari]TWB76188.1 opacity protein-like surface antigen [Bradyrhizobium sacchari]
MRSVKSLLAAGAATLISSMAFAADMPIAAPPPMYAPPAPPADFGGWYLRGDIGFSNQSVKSVRNTNDALYAPLLSFNQSTGFDTGGIFDLGVGYRVNNWFRVDATGQYRGRTNFHGLDLVSYPNGGPVGFGADNYGGSKSEWLFLANAYVDLGTWWCVTPFIGAGVGAARVTVANFTDSGINSLFGGGVGPSFVSAPTASQWNFAWALHTGLAYKVNPNLTVELGYSYVDLGDGITAASRAFDGSVGGHPFKFKDITSHDLKLGVRWDLSSPPAYVPPPLVTKG